MLLQLFFSFLQIGLFSIGGGYAAIPLIQSQIVDLHRWLTAEQFMDLATIAEMTPGPIALNGATFVGLKIAGWSGMLAAMAGCVLPSLIIVSLLSWLYGRFREMPMLKSVLAFLRPAVVALIGAAGLNMLLQVSFGGRERIAPENIQWAAAALSAVSLYVLRRFRLSPILIMALCGTGGLLLGLLGLF